MWNKKLNEMNKDEIQKTENLSFMINNDLKTIYIGAAERAIKALFITNGGGSIAILTFLHNPTLIQNRWLNASLFIFLTGTILALLIIGIDYYVCTEFLKNHRNNIRKLNNLEINLNDSLIYENDCLKKLVDYTTKIGYTSGFLFVIGCITGIIGYTKINYYL